MSEVQPPPGADSSGRRIGNWAIWWLRADPRPLLLLALVLMLACLWGYRVPNVAMVGLAYYYDFCLGVFVLMGLAVARSVQLFAMRYCERRLGVCDGARRSNRRFWPWLLGAAALTSILIWSKSPMRFGFWLSRPAMDRIAAEALANPLDAPSLAGRWVGLYYVSGVEVIGRTVVLYVGEDKGTYGFVRAPGATGDFVFNWPGVDMDNRHQFRDFPELSGFRDSTGDRIAGDWFVMYSHYWLIKIGWG